MYRCNDSVCDPICDFCWFCIHGHCGEPIQCKNNESTFNDGLGYCDRFVCSIHEPKPKDCRNGKIESDE